MNNYHKISITYIILIASIVAAFYILIRPHSELVSFNTMWILPLLYGLLFFMSKMRFAIFEYVGIFVLNIILFCRYVILPFYSSLTNLYFHSHATITDTSLNNSAIFLMAYEIICIFIVFQFFIIKLNTRKSITKNALLIKTNKFPKENFHFYYFAVFIGVLSFLLFPGVRERVNFFIIDEIGSSNLNTISSLGQIFSNSIFKLVFVIVVTKQLLRLHSGNKSNRFLVYVAVLLCISFVSSTNRTTILIQAIACLTILKSINLLNKKTLLITGTLTLLILLSLTSYRLLNRGQITTQVFTENGFSKQVIVDNLQSYFGGPHLIALAIKNEDNFSGSIESFSNEILSSIMFVRQVFPLDKSSSTVAFNKNFGFFDYNSMILPSLGQGYYYFGYLGAPLLSILFCYLIYIVEMRIVGTNHIGKKFALYILVLWLAFFPLQNLNIITSSFFNIFLPFYLIILLNKRLQV